MTTVIASIATAGPIVPNASADSWGCSYDKCLVVCQKVGGHYCSAYCTKQLKEKQLSKICK
jgi:hypothetical protein